MLSIIADGDVAMAHLPRPAEHQNHQGVELVRQGKHGDSIGCDRVVLRLRSAYLETLKNLGSGLVKCGKLENAIAGYREAVRLRPEYARALCNVILLILQNPSRT